MEVVTRRSTTRQGSAQLRAVDEPAGASILDFPAKRGKSRNAVNGRVPPRRRPNAERRSREYLLADEVDRLIKADRSVDRALDRHRAGRAAKLSRKVHPHMLRHAAGYKLANDGHDTRAIQQYLGHRNITDTVRYTELAPQRFNDFWKD